MTMDDTESLPKYQPCETQSGTGRIQVRCGG